MDNKAPIFFHGAFARYCRVTLVLVKHLWQNCRPQNPFTHLNPKQIIVHIALECYRTINLHMVVLLGRIKLQPHPLHHGLLHIIQILTRHIRVERFMQLALVTIFP